MHYSNDDDALVAMSEANEKHTHYKRYIVNRFMVMEIDGDNIVVADKEMGLTSQYKEGDELADGRIEKISEQGVVFGPPRADQCPFTLPMRSEMHPIAGDRVTKDRLLIEEDLKMRYDTQGPIILMMR